MGQENDSNGLKPGQISVYRSPGFELVARVDKTGMVDATITRDNCSLVEVKEIFRRVWEGPKRQ